jgi:hypothetical protein
MGKSIHCMKENVDTLLVTAKETGLEISTQKLCMWNATKF